MPKHVLVIGAGFAGLSAACHLAAGGAQVTVLEKNDGPGGRARQFSAAGFTFDMGPSWYWMPDVFERFFERFGKKVSDYYELRRLDPSYAVFFGPGDRLDVPATMPELEALFERLEPGSTGPLRRFLAEAAYKYRVGMGDFVYKPSLGPWEFADRRLLGGLFRLHLLRSMSGYLRQYFKNEKLLRLLEFPVLFLGAAPERTPALYSLMNYADLALGTWYPMGGLYKIVEAMTALAESLGVRFEFGQEVRQVLCSGDRAEGVQTAGGQIFRADAVLGAADYQHLDQQVLDPAFQNYSARYWETRAMAPSSLLFFVGLRKRIDGLRHHNLFFDEDFAQHARDIYDVPRWPEKPLFYVSAPSKTDPSVAPEGCENLFILIPLAPGLDDTPALREHYYRLVVQRLERHSGQRLDDDAVTYRRSYAPSDFTRDYHAYKGNAYGLANTLLQTAFLKPKLKNRHLRNFFYAGQLTVPGPGVPPSIISGEVAANLILKGLGG